MSQPGEGLPFRVRLLIELWDLVGSWERTLGKAAPLIAGRSGTSARTERHREAARTHLRALRRELATDLLPMLEELGAEIPEGLEP